MSKAQAGKLGGLATLARHGVQHMRAIGRQGGRAMWRKYRLHPYGTASFLLVSRLTGETVRVINPPIAWR